MKINIRFPINAFILLTAMILLMGIQAAYADNPLEKIPGVNHQYPDNFDDSKYGLIGNMDALYFGGKQVVMFTFSNADNSKYNKQLFFYSYDPVSGSNKGQALDVFGEDETPEPYLFKSCVYNNILYVFYKTSFDSEIHYRTFTLAMVDGDWSLQMTDVRSFPAGQSSAVLRAAVVMNSRIYVIFTNGTEDWYYNFSEDGSTFNPTATLLLPHIDSSIAGAGATVFQVPGEEDMERLMLAYATPRSEDSDPPQRQLKYFFFDGSKVSAKGVMEGPVSGVNPASVRLAAGSAAGYTSDKYAIQVWITHTHSTDWGRIFHREYIPSGPYGDEGYWAPSVWTQLSSNGNETSDNDDMIYDNYTQATFDCWAVTPSFTNIDNTDLSNVQMSLAVFYAKEQSGDDTQTVKFRSNTYQSDILAYLNTSTTDSGAQDLTTSTVLGVILGSPPFPENRAPQPPGQPAYASNLNLSTVELSASKGLTTSTQWSADGTITGSFGYQVPKIGQFQTSFSVGLSSTKTVTTSGTATTSVKLQSYDRGSRPETYAGDTGWVVSLVPEIVNDTYVLHSWEGTELHYDNYTGGDDTLKMSVITYGPNTCLIVNPFRLDKPTMDYASGGYPDTALFEGMFKGMENGLPFSTDVMSWQNALPTASKGVYSRVAVLPTIAGRPTEGATETITMSKTEADCQKNSIKFSASATLLGFGISDVLDYVMNITTTTVLTRSLGWNYNLLECTNGPICIPAVNIVPSILSADPSDSGYNAPWISDDIRKNQKPKPWCLSYTAYPIDPVVSSSMPQELSADKTYCSFDRSPKRHNADSVLAAMELEGLNSDFSLKELLVEGGIHLRFGNFVANSKANHVVCRRMQGKQLVLKIREAETGAWIELRLRRNGTRLCLRLDAHRVDLSHLFRSYQPKSWDQESGKTIPFSLYLGNKYFADGNLQARWLAKKRRLVLTGRQVD